MGLIKNKEYGLIYRIKEMLMVNHRCRIYILRIYVKRIIVLVLCAMLNFIMFYYVSNLNDYIKLSKVSKKNDSILVSQDIDEDKFDYIIDSYKQSVGNDYLHKKNMNRADFNNMKEEIIEFIIENVLLKKIEKMKDSINVHRNITYDMYSNVGYMRIIDKFCIRQLNIKASIEKCVGSMYKDAIYYPVVHISSNEGSYPFENTWWGTRRYGGDRRHEGTDIMYSKNIEDVVPIASVSDGVVEKKGWLNLGGYRLLIKASDNVKYYYAHLSSYADNIEEGSIIKAGQIIGYMGSTGYGEEGTKGKFDVHLHFGMYYFDGSEEIGINPYFLLKMLKYNKLYYK